MQAANTLLEHRAPDVSPVTNAGDALMVLILDRDRLDLDYTSYHGRWDEIRKGNTSTCYEPRLSGGIIATTRGAVEVTSKRMTIEESLEVANEITFQHPENRVILGQLGEPPRVDGVDLPLLSPAAYNVVSVLIRAGRTGLVGKAIRERSGHKDAVKILKRLARKPGWKDVIHMPGKHGRGYWLLFK